MSETERRVWSRLRGKQLGGHKFRRQLPIGPYFADFACLSARLVVEIDGPEHYEEPDGIKTAYLETQGFRVARFPVSDVDESIEDVIEAIYCQLESPHPGRDAAGPPRQAGRKFTSPLAGEGGAQRRMGANPFDYSR